MSFLAPLMLLGVALVAVPIVIHLIGRRRAPVKRFGAIDLLLGENRRVAKQLELRERLLLFARGGAVLAVALALAKPFASCSGTGPEIARGPQAAAIILDTSFAMSYADDDGALDDAIRARARQILDAIGPEADVAVLTTTDVGAPRELTRDHLRLRTTIDETRPSARTAEIAKSIATAAGLVGASPHAARRIYLVTALTRGAFEGGAPPPSLLPDGVADVELHVVDVAPSRVLPNLAVVSAHAERDPELGGRAVRITAEITNDGPRPVEDRAITVSLGGRAVARGLVSVPAGQTVSKRFSITLSDRARGEDGEVALEHDALPIDDVRHLRVELRREVRVLLVDGEPAQVRHEDELFYLETALRPGDRSDSALAVAVTTVDDLPRRRLGDFDVVVLANVVALPAERATELASWVDRGGGLFVTLGKQVDVDAYARTMGPLLAAPLHAAREIAPGASDKERAGRAERLGRLESGHPIFAIFTAGAPGLREARFDTIVLTTGAGQADTSAGDAGTEGRRVLARYAGGAPALIEAQRGAGRLLLLTSTIDRDWNDLAIHPGFLPFVQQIVRYLARSPAEDPDAEPLVGRPLALPVSPEDTRLEITLPRGRKLALEGKALAGHANVQLTETDEPGIYSIAASTSAGGRPRAVARIAVNLDPRGSDLRRVEVAASQGKAATGSASPGPRPLRRVELWHAVAAALLALLLGEALLLSRRG